MSVEERKIDWRMGADNTDAKRAFAETKQSAREMAEGINQAGQHAGQRLQQIGASAEAAGQKLDKAAKSFRDQLRERAALDRAGGNNGIGQWKRAAAINPDARRPIGIDGVGKPVTVISQQIVGADDAGQLIQYHAPVQRFCHAAAG